MNRQSQQLSALYDGELENHEIGSVCTALRQGAGGMATWQTYAAISDQLRGEAMGCGNLVDAVMIQVREEPVVLAPGALRRGKTSSATPPAWLALAASLAGVAVVGWLAFAELPGTAMTIAAVSPAPTFSRIELAAKTASPALPRGDTVEMGDYLLAHHAQASAFRLGDGAQHVRTVSMTSRGARP